MGDTLRAANLGGSGKQYQCAVGKGLPGIRLKALGTLHPPHREHGANM